MANVATTRLLGRNLLRYKNFKLFNISRISTAVLHVDFHNNPLVLQKHERKTLYKINSHRLQFYSKESSIRKDDKEKLSLFQRFKQMYKDYWYVLVPVHLVTSAAWFGGFYYLAKSGVDIPSLLESLNVSQKITNPLRDSSMGYLAVAYALYKLATPARYTVTLGGTTISINYLTKWGYLKPVPSRERLKEMYLEQKDNLLETMRETKEGLKIQSEKLKDKKENIIEEIKDLGEKITKEVSKENVIKDLKKKTEKIKEKN